MFLKPFSIFTFRTSQLPILHIYNFDQNWCSTTTKLQQTFVVNIFLCFRLFSLISNCQAFFLFVHFSKQISRFCYICLKGINWLILKDLLSHRISILLNWILLSPTVYVFFKSWRTILHKQNSTWELLWFLKCHLKIGTHWLVNKLKR